MPQSLTWKSLLPQITKHKKSLFLGNIIALAAVLLSVPIPLLMPLMVDEVLLAKPGNAVSLMTQMLPPNWATPTGFLITILLAVVLMRIMALILDVLQTRQFSLIGKDISFQIRKRLLKHLPDVHLKEYELRGSSGISARCIMDVETLDQFVSQTLSSFIVAVLTVIGIAGVLLWLNWQLALIIILLNPAVIYFSRSFGKKVGKLKAKENNAFEAFQLALVETLDAISQLKAARREKQYFERTIAAAATLKECAINSQWKSDAMHQLSFTVFLLGFEVFRTVAMFMVLFSGLSIGEMFAVFAYLWFMMGPVQEILNIQYAYFRADAALKRLNEVFQFKTEPVYPTTTNPFSQNTSPQIQFEDVHFSYKEQQALLHNINFTVPSGKTVALVSMSGGGKSTIIQLLLGLYHKSAGEIRFNDNRVEEIGYDVIRENTSAVLQQPILFNSTIRENLQMGNEKLEEADLWKALHMAELAETVRDLEHSLDTQVGQNGIRLSGGQKQRLAIARMVLTDPKVVILDEATSALDAQTEQKVFDNLQAFLENRTTIIIAHRMSAIRHADAIFVLEDGTISQSGVHQELIEQNGLYQTFYQHQMV